MDNILDIRYRQTCIVFTFISLPWLWYNAKSLYQGAYTGVCSAQHVPSYKKNIDKFKAKGIDSVICVAVNDPYTMNAWAEKLEAKDVVRSFCWSTLIIYVFYTFSVTKKHVMEGYS